MAFPDSIVGFFIGDLGQPPGGFPQGAAEEGAVMGQAAAHRTAGQLPQGCRSRGAERAVGAVEKETGEKLDDLRLASHLMYPKVFADYLNNAGTPAGTASMARAADAGLFLRPRSRARRSSSRSSAARRW